jgi:chromosome condensin MukBEF ATPase and DNA-binding subunit MukB
VHRCIPNLKSSIYDVLASLLATGAQDLANIVAEFEAGKKAEALVCEEGAELREQLEEVEVKLDTLEKEQQLELEHKGNEILAYQRVVEMRSEERNRARQTIVELEGNLMDAAEQRCSMAQELEQLRTDLQTLAQKAAAGQESDRKQLNDEIESQRQIVGSAVRE